MHSNKYDSFASQGTAAEQKVSEILKCGSLQAVKKASQLRSLQSAITLQRISKAAMSNMSLQKSMQNFKQMSQASESKA